MASADKIFYLENNKNRFWELTICGSESIVRYGKVGCKGRRCSAKTHDSPVRCRQWAVLQANMKQFEGYEEPSEKNQERTTLKRRLTSVHAERLGFSKQETTCTKNDNGTNQPVRLTKRQQSLANLKTAAESNTETKQNKWRHPPKKQRTIRNLKLEQGHANLKTAADSKTTTKQKDWRKPPKKQSTIRNLAQQKEDKTWRKPHKKQATVRAIGTLISFQERHVGGYIKRGQSLARKQSTVAPKDWRRLSRRQTTFRALEAIANYKEELKSSDENEREKPNNLPENDLDKEVKAYRRPPKKQATIRKIAKTVSLVEKLQQTTSEPLNPGTGRHNPIHLTRKETVIIN